ncbi:hypothetical protein OUZ56_025205 [Daphnia magna]|uniref:Secreted protein n=1 Tax=Daphnia magna TaxID=35525 RepID=A0ABQ9ZJ65_9CRUS|nr:hypothetical protein OUZ56_025205 [Daphnia magna]
MDAYSCQKFMFIVFVFFLFGFKCVGCVFHPRWEVHFLIKKVIYCGIVKKLTHLSNRYRNPTRLTGATTNN